MTETKQGFKIISGEELTRLFNGSAGVDQALVLDNGHGIKLVPLARDARKLYLEVTTGCNFDCTTCIRNSWLDGTGQMDWDTFQNIINGLEQFPDLTTVHFGGFGEPLSHPKIVSMLEKVTGAGVGVEMITNGSLLDEKMAETLLDLGIERIYISLDGPDEQEYNQIRQGADFHQVFANIKNLHRRKKERGLSKPSINIEFVAMRSNFHRLPDLVALLPEFGAQELLVTNVMPYHQDLVGETLYGKQQKLFDNHQIFAMMRAKLPQMELRSLRYCKFIEDKAMVINWRGEVNPCYAMMHTYHCYVFGRQKKFYKHSFGNVSETALADIWRNPQYAYFRSKVKEFNFPSCTDCQARDGCAPPDNLSDCWGNTPSCADCLWSRGIIVCP